MSKQAILERIEDVGVLAVLRGPSEELTLKMVDALIKGGVIGIEITYSTPNAAKVVKSLDQEFGDRIVLGMGTLTKPAQVEEALSSGATFLVSPHTSVVLGKEMAASGAPVMMGALTPSEVMKAYEMGSDVVKIFPGSLGGPSYMKALKGPFPDIPMMPTGGVSENNLVDWFKAGAFAVGAGSNLCPKEFALSGEFEKITEVASNFMAAVKAARA
ncbi:MAG: bifunctional 4-hydroxy-2-oxoglutarate aldolase/2-dehydro-3-deoxy-phosphogluconate aldolase [Anaerolineales bacterium]